MPAAAFQGASISLARAGMRRWATGTTSQLPAGAHQSQRALEQPCTVHTQTGLSMTAILSLYWHHWARQKPDAHLRWRGGLQP